MRSIERNDNSQIPNHKQYPNSNVQNSKQNKGIEAPQFKFQTTSTKTQTNLKDQIQNSKKEDKEPALESLELPSLLASQPYDQSDAGRLRRFPWVLLRPKREMYCFRPCCLVIGIYLKFGA